jgi:hypothetical protein
LRRWCAALCALVVLSAACRDTLQPEQGAFVGRWDGRMWVGDASAMLLRGAMQGDVLHVFGVSPRGAGAFTAEETISASVIFRGVGMYALGADDVSFTELTGGDVVSALYRGVGSPAGVLRVSHYDETTGAIEGELRFAAATDSPHASYGSSARLDDGRFRTVLAVQRVNTRAP